MKMDIVKWVYLILSGLFFVMGVVFSCITPKPSDSLGWVVLRSLAAIGFLACGVFNWRLEALFEKDRDEEDRVQNKRWAKAARSDVGAIRWPGETDHIDGR